MHKIKSTYKMLAHRAMQKDSVEEWKDWALEMLEAGFETEHLIILAGLSPHLNRFELTDIINKALKELSLDMITEDEMIYNYVYYMIDETLQSKIPYETTLGTIRDICRDRDYDSELYEFYLLAYAKEDLADLGVQFYWRNSDDSDIDSVISEKFHAWKNKYENGNQK